MKTYHSPEIEVLNLAGNFPLAMSGDGSEYMDDVINGSMGLDAMGKGGTYVW